MLTDEEFEELEEITRGLVNTVNRYEELGGILAPRYMDELKRYVKCSEEFHRKTQKPVKIISEIKCDYSQEKVFRDLSLKRLAKNGIHP